MLASNPEISSESTPPSWLLRLLDELGFLIPPHVRPVTAYMDRFGDARYVFEVDYGVYGGESRPQVVELLEEDLHTLLTPKQQIGKRENPLDDPELARLTPRRDFYAEVWRKSLHPALVKVGKRHALKRAASWYRKEEAPEWLIRAMEKVEGAGAGLSNGAKHAATIPAASLHSPKAWLTATLEHRPGTLHVKIKGRYSISSPGAKRGEIKRITSASMQRLANLTRELEAVGMAPEIMLTLTYPADWKGALGADRTFLSRYEQALRKLKKLSSLWHSAKKQYERTGRLPRNYRTLEAMYLEALKEVNELAEKFLHGLPDGRLVKRHLDAFLKRFDRSLGHKILATAPDKETAEAIAEHYKEEYPKVKVLKRKKGGYNVVAVLYRVLWWMEFQRRGAPHLHLMLFYVVGLDIEEIRRWIGQAWTGVVFGLRKLNQYFSAEVTRTYDNLRAMWGKEAGEAFFAEWLASRGLDFEVWKHLRAGTRVERMRKDHWGYVNKEVIGGKAKAYQRRVPKLYRNIGRWWGYRNYKRKKPKRIKIPMSDQNAFEVLLEALNHAAKAIPKPAFRFRQKLERALTAIRDKEPYAYITLWGEAGGLALSKVERALAA